MSEHKPIRVFVTHAFSESDDYLRLFEFLECVDNFYYLNVSLPEEAPKTGGMQEIKDILIQQIKEAEAVFVLASLFETQPDLVNFMMDGANAAGKPIIVLRPFGGVTETIMGFPAHSRRPGAACACSHRHPRHIECCTGGVACAATIP